MSSTIQNPILTGFNPDPSICRVGDTEIYFVTSRGQKELRFTAPLRTSGKTPELWDAERGTHRTAPSWRIQAAYTEVDLLLPANTSAFIVLRETTAATFSAPLAIEGAGEVLFPEAGLAWHAPFQVPVVRRLTQFPDWLIQRAPRPSSRKTFSN